MQCRLPQKPIRFTPPLSEKDKRLFAKQYGWRNGIQLSTPPSQTARTFLWLGLFLMFIVCLVAFYAGCSGY